MAPSVDSLRWAAKGLTNDEAGNVRYRAAGTAVGPRRQIAGDTPTIFLKPRLNAASESYPTSRATNRGALHGLDGV
jgi:hypothetical protein